MGNFKVAGFALFFVLISSLFINSALGLCPLGGKQECFRIMSCVLAAEIEGADETSGKSSSNDSADELLKIISGPVNDQHKIAVKELISKWDSLTYEQMEKYFKSGIVAAVICRDEYPQGIEAVMGTRYCINYGWDGWPRVKGIKMKAVTRKYLDSKPYGKPFSYDGHQASAGGIGVDGLSKGEHSAHIVTEYKIHYKDWVFSGKVKSKTAKFKVVDNNIIEKMAAKQDPKLTAMVEENFKFNELRDPKNGGSRFGGIHDPDFPWKPQNSSKRRGSEDVYAIHVPNYSLAKPLDVELCFDVKIRVIETGKVYDGWPIIVKRGESGELGRFTVDNSMKFVMENPGFVTAKIVLEPSYKLAMSDTRVKKFYNGTLTSKPLRFRSYWFKYDQAKPWEKEMVGMYKKLKRAKNSDRQLYYTIRSMTSVDPFQRLGAVRSLKTSVVNGKDIGPAIPFLEKIAAGNGTILQQRAAMFAERLIAEYRGMPIETPNADVLKTQWGVNKSPYVRVYDVRKDMPDNLKKHRARMLSQIDKKIRTGIRELAWYYPHLKKAVNYERSISGPSPNDTISIKFLRSDENKADITEKPIPKKEQFTVKVLILPPPETPLQIELLEMFPDLGLLGKVEISAGDAELWSALEDVVTKSLDPLYEWQMYESEKR